MSNCTLLKNLPSVIFSFSKFLFSIPLGLLLIALSCNSASAAQKGERQPLIVNDDLEQGVVVHLRPTPLTDYKPIPPVQYDVKILVEVNPEVAQQQWNTIADLVTVVCDKRYFKKIAAKHKEAPEESIHTPEKLIEFLKKPAFAVLTQEPFFSTYQQGLRIQTIDLMKAIKEFIKSDDLLRKQNKSLLRDIDIYLEQLAEKDRDIENQKNTLKDLESSRNFWRTAAIGASIVGVVGIVGSIFLTHYFWRP